MSAAATATAVPARPLTERVDALALDALAEQLDTRGFA
jgi:hypothetical protein